MNNGTLYNVTSRCYVFQFVCGFKKKLKFLKKKERERGAVRLQAAFQKKRRRSRSRSAHVCCIGLCRTIEPCSLYGRAHMNRDVTGIMACSHSTETVLTLLLAPLAGDVCIYNTF